MTAGRLDLIIEQGAAFWRRLTWQDGDGNPVDLTGYSARMQVRDGYGGAQVIELTTANGRITLGGADGTIELSIAATDTAALSVDLSDCRRTVPARQRHVYDLELEASDGTVTRLVEGLADIHAEATT